MEEHCQFPLGFGHAMERKLSGPGRQGWDLSRREKIPSTQPGGELYRCAFRQGASLSFYQGQALRTKAQRGQQNIPEQRCSHAIWSQTPL